MSGIPNDDESLELVERMLLLFHLPEFFQKEETKKYSDALRFLEEADPNQPDCLALLETQPQLVSEPVRGGFRHLLYFPPNSFPSQKLGRGWIQKGHRVAAIMGDPLSGDALNLDSTDERAPHLNEFVLHEIDLNAGSVTVRIPASLITAENPRRLESLTLENVDPNLFLIRAFMLWENFPKHDQAWSLLNALSEYAKGEASEPVRQIIEKVPPVTVPPTEGFAATSENLLDHAYRSISNLHNSYLPIQGPPGTGKTYLGSSVIRRLLKDGKRIAITSQSWAAINNLLCATFKKFEDEDENALLKSILINHRNLDEFSDKHAEFAHYIDEPLAKGGLYFGELDNEEPTGNLTWYRNKRNPARREIAGPPEPGKDFHSGAQLLATTSYFLASSGMQQACRMLEAKDSYLFDYLFIDEAGQFSLAETLAIASIAKNVVLLGDPKQLPQVTMAKHSHNSGLSVLEYLIGKENNADPSQGYFLETTYRMRPEVNRFISDEFYSSELKTAEIVKRREILGIPNGLYFVEMEHSGCQKESEEEANVVREIIRKLVGKEFLSEERRSISYEDFMVVAPYGDQVSAIEENLFRAANENFLGTLTIDTSLQIRIEIIPDDSYVVASTKINSLTSEIDDLPKLTLKGGVEHLGAEFSFAVESDRAVIEDTAIKYRLVGRERSQPVIGSITMPAGESEVEVTIVIAEPTSSDVAVGTVDKFQGQEAPIVIYSMTSSSPDDIPTGRYDFIFSPNRLNVAVSRAQCIAVVIGSKDLINTHPKKISTMGDLNHICRVFQDTEGISPISRPFPI